MIKAVKQGRVEFVTEILKACPDLVWCVEKSKDRHIFMVAVLCRYPAMNLSFTFRNNEVESIVCPSILEGTNTNGKRPRELFIESHKELVKEGEKWMKGTTSSCTVVAALIVTIMFAIAITVPGGNKQDSGMPTFLNEKVFMVFIISDALSLLSASTSLLMKITGGHSYHYHATVPVTLFAWMQFRLLIDMVISTYASRILDKKAKYGS
ncbi:uncharacterized protein LOC115985268 [Quercus lobata]|uniref:uncharacterized protein LOC115985268 n=1 Tax=Quercus lobata TaxID=97700 RepID=UPI0012473E07|nr:uncharacterized protein LOC115985268 [Quercus lobata]